MVQKKINHAVMLEALRPLAHPIGDFAPDPKNARKHGEENIRAIVSSLKLYGQRSPIIAQRNKDGGKHIVRAGSGRLRAARILDWKYIAAVIVDEPDLDAIGFAIADNRAAELATWDIDNLLDNMAIVEHLGLENVGFTEADLADIIDKGHLDELPSAAAPDPLEREPVISYTLTFDSAVDHKIFMKFLKSLKEDHPDIDTHSGRLIAFLNELSAIMDDATTAIKRLKDA